MYQRLMLLGRLGKDMEVTGSGQTARGNFSVATDSAKKDRDGNWQKETTWFYCTVFGKRAENLSKYMLKGTSVFIEGQIREYQKNDGSMGWGVNVKDIQLASSTGGRPDRDAQQREKNQQQPSVAAYSGSSGVTNDEIPF